MGSSAGAYFFVVLLQKRASETLAVPVAASPSAADSVLASNWTLKISVMTRVGKRGERRML